MLSSPDYDAVILDLGLPTIDGLTVLKRLRDRGSVIPVLILSARGQLGDRVSGLNLGADDYLPKPFDLSELDARLHALIRRANGTPRADVAPRRPGIRQQRPGVPTGRRDPDAATEGARRSRGALAARRQGHQQGAVVRESIFHRRQHGADVVEIYIHRLRKHLQDSGLSIVTLRGLGYVLEAPLTASSAS